MDLGTVVDRRSDLRWRGSGPIQIARLPSRRGGAICDSGATVAFMTTTANVDDHPSHPQAQFLRPGATYRALLPWLPSSESVSEAHNKVPFSIPSSSSQRRHCLNSTIVPRFRSVTVWYLM